MYVCCRIIAVCYYLCVVKTWIFVFSSALYFDGTWCRDGSPFTEFPQYFSISLTLTLSPLSIPPRIFQYSLVPLRLSKDWIYNRNDLGRTKQTFTSQIRTIAINNFFFLYCSIEQSTIGLARGPRRVERRNLFSSVIRAAASFHALARARSARLVRPYNNSASQTILNPALPLSPVSNAYTSRHTSMRPAQKSDISSLYYAVHIIYKFDKLFFSVAIFSLFVDDTREPNTFWDYTLLSFCMCSIIFSSFPLILCSTFTCFSRTEITEFRMYIYIIYSLKLKAQLTPCLCVVRVIFFSHYLLSIVFFYFLRSYSQQGSRIGPPFPFTFASFFF